MVCSPDALILLDDGADLQHELSVLVHRDRNIHKGYVDAKGDIARSLHDLLQVVLLLHSLHDHDQLELLLRVHLVVIGRNSRAELL